MKSIHHGFAIEVFQNDEIRGVEFHVAIRNSKGRVEWTKDGFKTAKKAEDAAIKMINEII